MEQGWSRDGRGGFSFSISLLVTGRWRETRDGEGVEREREHGIWRHGISRDYNGIQTTNRLYNRRTNTIFQTLISSVLYQYSIFFI